MASCSPCRAKPRGLIRWIAKGKSEEGHVHRIARRADYPVQERIGRREGIREVRGLADRGRHRRAGPVRHHRRIADPLDGRAQARHRHLHQRGQGHGRAGDRRHRLELDRPRRSSSPSTPRRPAPTPPCWSCPITTSRPRKACSSISRRWPKPSTFPSCSTTCRRAPVATCRSRRSIRLSQVKNIIGIKDASYDMARPT